MAKKQGSKSNKSSKNAKNAKNTKNAQNARAAVSQGAKAKTAEAPKAVAQASKPKHGLSTTQKVILIVICVIFVLGMMLPMAGIGAVSCSSQEVQENAGAGSSDGL
jgi:hypothetical protein